MTGRRFLGDERGNIAVLFACGFALSAIVSALAVDAAALYHERRMMQAGVDLAAISAAADPARAAEIARSVLSGARLLPPDGTDGLTVITGRYDETLPEIGSRFQPGAAAPNAVQVSLERPGRLYFAASFTGAPTIGVSGIAAAAPEVAFSVGSRLAGLEGGMVNALLSTLLGTTLELSVMDHAALAAAEIGVLDFLDALAPRMGVSVASYDELLAMEADAGTVAGALADLLTGPARSALERVAGAGPGSPVALGKLFSLGRLGGLAPGEAGPVAGLSVSALDLLGAAAALADGRRQAALALGASVPGLATLKLDLAVGEPPQGGQWFASGPAGTVVRTVQTRLRLEAGLLGGPVLLGAGVRLPLWLDLAHAEARVTEAACPSAAAPNGSATLDVRPGALRFALGEMSAAALHDFGTPPPVASVALVDALLLKVTGSALVELARTAPAALHFSSAEIGAGRVKTARTTTPIASLAGSLLDRLDLTVRVLGLGLSPPHLVERAVRDLLAPLAPILDATIETALSVLGLGIGEADLRVHGVRCTAPVLVG